MNAPRIEATIKIKGFNASAKSQKGCVSNSKLPTDVFIAIGAGQDPPPHDVVSNGAVISFSSRIVSVTSSKVISSSAGASLGGASLIVVDWSVILLLMSKLVTVFSSLISKLFGESTVELSVNVMVVVSTCVPIVDASRSSQS
jgi:hypothetical protein